MGKTLVLDRVAADLSRGLTHPAIQRLSSLVAAHPTDLDLRRRLAAVHRRVGNRIQAGRWDYLTIGADSSDTTAFERAFPSANARLRAVRWPYRANAAATSYARGRLTKLVTAAEAELGTRRPATAGAGLASPASSNGARGKSGKTTARRGTRSPLAILTRRLVARMRLRSVNLRSITFTLAVAAGAGLVVVGGVTVLEWLVQ